MTVFGLQVQAYNWAEWPYLALLFLSLWGNFRPSKKRWFESLRGRSWLFFVLALGLLISPITTIAPSGPALLGYQDLIGGHGQWVMLLLCLTLIFGASLAAVDGSRRNILCIATALTGAALVLILRAQALALVGSPHGLTGWGIVTSLTCLLAACLTNVWELVPADIRYDTSPETESSETRGPVGKHSSVWDLVRGQIVMVTDQNGDYPVSYYPVSDLESIRVCLAYTDVAGLEQAHPHSLHSVVKGFDVMATLAKQGISGLLLDARTPEARVIQFDAVPELKDMLLPFDPLGRTTPWIAVAHLGSEHSQSVAQAQSDLAPPKPNSQGTAPEPTVSQPESLRVADLAKGAVVITVLGVVHVALMAGSLVVLALDLLMAATIGGPSLVFRLIAYFPSRVVVRRRLTARLSGSVAMRDPLAEPQPRRHSWTDKLLRRIDESEYMKLDPLQHQSVLDKVSHPIAREQRNQAIRMLQSEPLRELEWQTSDVRNLDRIIALAELALIECPANDPYAAFANYVLGSALHARYLRTGEVTNLFRARIGLERARSGLGVGDSRLRLVQRKVLVDKPEAARSLGAVLLDCYRRSGNPQDLDEAIQELEKAVVHPRARHMVSLLRTLSDGYSERYARAGGLSDLDLAITALNHALDATDDNSTPSTERIALIRELGNCLQLRFTSEGDIGDLKGALALYEGASATLKEEALVQSMINPGYGRALLLRYGTRHDRTDLVGAVAALRAAIGQTRVEAPEAAETMRTLGAALLAAGSEHEIAEAAQVLSQALELTPIGSPQRAQGLLLLGRVMRLRGERANNAAFSERGLNYLEEAMVQAEATAPDVALAAAADLSLHAVYERDATRTAKACDTGLNTAASLLSTQLLRTHKEAWLRRASALSARGACAHAVTGHAEAAVVMLERGRLLLFSEVLEADLSGVVRLEDQEPELYADYRRAADALRAIERADLAPKSSLRPTERAAHARRVREDFSRATKQIREVPGFADFLRAPTFQDVRDAADHPLVYVASSERVGVALIVEPASAMPPRSIWLERLSVDSVTRAMTAQAEAYDARVEDPARWRRELNVLGRWLWDAAVGPIIEALGNVERVILVPTGVLGVLPFHIAWTPTERGARLYALDRTAITYAPSARVLSSERMRERPPAAQGILGVYSNELSSSAAEIQAAVRWFSDAKIFAATKHDRDEILAQLPRWPTLHFACHSQADAERPLEGGLLLDQGARITVRDLLGGDILNSQLVVLSACESGVAGQQLPDEAIGLPTALIQAGVSGVISSGWSVPDTSSFLVSARFHELWRKDGLAPWSALRQAQRWVRDSTNEEKAMRFPSVGEIQGGTVSERNRDFWAGAHGHSHPYHWGAFMYSGV